MDDAGIPKCGVLGSSLLARAPGAVARRHIARARAAAWEGHGAITIRAHRRWKQSELELESE